MNRPPVSQHRDRLGTHQPEWLDHTPLGIFIHWGAYSVPSWAEPHGELGTEPDERTWFTHNSYAEWYFNTIRIPGSRASQYHHETYGSLPYDGFLTCGMLKNSTLTTGQRCSKKPGQDWLS